ncbi:MAG: LptF/LptG family permease [Nitrospirota bacterium]
MKILQRLYLKEFLILLALIAIGLSTVFSLLDFMGNIDDFMRGNPSAGSLALYVLLNMPKFFLYILPMSALICSLFVFSQASRRKEIIAVKAAGGRLRNLLYPFLGVSILLSIFAFITGEIIIPDFSKKAFELKNAVGGKSRSFAFSDGSMWLKSKDGSPVKIDLYIIDRKLAKGVDIFFIGEDFLKERLAAEKAFWDGETWILENVTKYDIGSGKIEKIQKMNYPGLDSPEIFSEEIKPPDEMGISELYRYIKRLKIAGYRNLKLTVDFNSKISFPLINIFMMLLGISLSTRGKTGGGLFSAGLGLLISLSYWFGYTFMLSFGYAGIIPPLIAAWTVPFIFGLFSVYLFLKIPE